MLQPAGVGTESSPLTTGDAVVPVVAIACCSCSAPYSLCNAGMVCSPTLYMPQNIAGITANRHEDHHPFQVEMASRIAPRATQVTLARRRRRWSPPPLGYSG